MQLADLPTPALILDRARLERNTSRMAGRATAAGVGLRPHVKTAKCVEVAELATRGHSGGITVSTLAEAEWFAARGFSDITYGVCMVPDKLPRVAALAQGGASVQLITDDAPMAAALGERARELDQTFRVLVELDCGEHRTGVNPRGEGLLEVAGRIHQASHLELAGVLTHAGHSYDCRSVADVERVAEDERTAAVGAAERLREAGLPCDTVSGGSTPTAVHARSYDGLTEIRPGVYVFFDIAQLGRQSCTADDLALSVLATVISHRPEHGRLLLDAGGLALSKDLSGNALFERTGYGWVFDLSGTRRIGDLHVSAADQEHGFVEGTGIPWATLPIGSQVRVFPNHACMTAAAHSHYHIVEGNEVVDRWQRCAGW